MRAVDFGEVEQVEVFVGNHTLIGEELEVDDPLPIVAAEQDDRDLLHAAGLAEGEGIEQFVECPEAAWKDDQRGGPQQFREVQVEREEEEIAFRFNRPLPVARPAGPPQSCRLDV